MSRGLGDVYKRQLYIKEDKEKGYCKLAPAVIVKSNGTCRGFEEKEK